MSSDSEIDTTLKQKMLPRRRVLGIAAGSAALGAFAPFAGLSARPAPPTPLAPPPPGPPKVILGASMVDVARGLVIPDAAILITGHRITAAGPAAAVAVPEGATTIRLDGHWLIPGLINNHVHLGNRLPGAAGAALANESPSHQILRMQKAAREALDSGVTTVRITGAEYGNDFDLKRAINAGYAIGPRIETAGQVIVPSGGHGNREANGPAEFAKAVREQIENGASWIKISISGGIADAHGDIAASPMMLDELKTVIEVAHRNGVKVTAHNGSPAAADDAIALGIDCFEHGYYLGRKQLQAMKDKGIWLCPTIGVSQASVMEFFKRQGMPEWYMERVRSVSKAHWAMLQEAIRLGVNIAMGTDQNPAEPNAGTTATIRELEMYVEAGMTPLNSLRTATSAAAEMLGLTADVGSLSAGRFADIVAVKQNPLENIAALRTINFVMKGGQIARQG
ncbi:MAG: hypothetical protein RL481_2490 [Pseudomonadota bacterium]